MKTYNLDDLYWEDIKTIEELNLPIVQDAFDAIARLKDGISIARYEFGDSMEPILEDGQFCEISPIDGKDLKVGDAVFCRVDGIVGTHMIIMISDADPANRWYAIGTSDLDLIGWTREVFGISKPIPYKII